jgi:NADPH-dependent ferric siderophore reductase
MSSPQTSSPVPVRRSRPAPMRAEVRRVRRLSERMRRVVVGGGELDRFSWPGPGSHLKLMLPEPGERAPRLPTPGPDGQVQFDRSVLTMRTYTPRAWNPQTAELTIDVFLHGDGPASVWARQVGIGDQVGLSQPRASYQPDPAAEWLVLAGDETAVPAICTIIEACAAAPMASPVVLIESEGDDLDLGLPAGTGARFVTREGGQPGRALLATLAAVLPEGDGRVWVAGEAHGIRAIRGFLRDERAMSPASIVTRGYWKLGAADHPDHDFGED